MPRSASTRPRNMLPPPTTTATWVPSRTAATICSAICSTTSWSMPSGSSPEKAAPDSLSTTRCQVRCIVAFVVSCTAGSVTARPPSGMSGLPHLEVREAADGYAVFVQHLLDGLLGLLDEGLLDQDAPRIGEEPVEPSVDDLRHEL